MKCGDIVVYKNQVGKIVKNENNFKFLPCAYGRYYSSELDTITENEVREATHEEKIDFIEREFKWGFVVEVHCIGEYQIVEYVNQKDNKTYYHGYINYTNTNCSYLSLDSALIGCIGYKYEGGNGKAAMYFEKMIDLK